MRKYRTITIDMDSGEAKYVEYGDDSCGCEGHKCGKNCACKKNRHEEAPGLQLALVSDKAF